MWLVRHGRASAGWDVDPDPPLDDAGRAQAVAVARSLSSLGPMRVVTSPLLRCRQTAFPLATAWSVEPSIDDRVAEIPSPEGHSMATRIEWLRDAMSKTWTVVAGESGDVYETFRRRLVAAIAGAQEDTVVFTHFVAINAVIGAATADDRVLIASLDNCSVTTVEVAGDGSITLGEVGRQADTLIR